MSCRWVPRRGTNSEPTAGPLTNVIAGSTVNGAAFTGVTNVNQIALGHLNVVDLRDIWRSEARDFSPWLSQAEHLALLGEMARRNMRLRLLADHIRE